jgi:hypothetical protein
MALTWTAWNNGKHLATGAGYGLKVPVIDRDRYFKHEWTSVILEIPVDRGFAEVAVNVDKPSFWNEKCHELISQEIGQWLRNSGLAPWPPHQPPKLLVEVISEGRFRISGINS